MTWQFSSRAVYFKSKSDISKKLCIVATFQWRALPLKYLSLSLTHTHTSLSLPNLEWSECQNCFVFTILSSGMLCGRISTFTCSQCFFSVHCTGHTNEINPEINCCLFSQVHLHHQKRKKPRQATEKELISCSFISQASEKGFCSIWYCKWICDNSQGKVWNKECFFPSYLQILYHSSSTGAKNSGNASVE